MKEPWTWKGLFGDLVRARGSDRQLPQYAAVAAGVRRAMDDWIATESLEELRAIARRIGLRVEVDCLFMPLDEERVVGIEYAPTTRAAAVPYRPGAPAKPDSYAHVIVSSRADWAAEAMASAWYSVEVAGRILRKPLIDHLWLGEAFGYPRCCVEFFVRHNDWPRQSLFAEAASRSSRFHWEANCFTKLTPWMTIYHMPCAFDCPATLRYTRDVLRAVGDIDRGYAERIRASMERPCLVLNERFACALLGARRLGADRIRYAGVEDLFEGAPGRDTRTEGRVRTLMAGDELLLRDGAVLVSSAGEPVALVEGRCDRGVAEVPLLFAFE